VAVEMSLPTDRHYKKWRPRKSVSEAAHGLDIARLRMRNRAWALRRVRRALDKAEWVQPSVREQVATPEAPQLLAKPGDGHAVDEPRLI
jgi:hypothetical protein